MIERVLAFVTDKTLTLAAFVVVLGIIIFVHELGHFMVAKLFRMRVFIFSFGFGKRLFGVKRGDTDYRVSLVPLGGYVKLEGEADDYLSESTAHEGDGKDFLTRPRWQRFLVYIAGPLMNVVLTVGVFTALYMVGVYEPSDSQSRPIVGAVTSGLPAQAAGIEAGDEVVAVDGRPISTWEQLQLQTALAPGRVLRLTVRRAGGLRQIEVRPVAVGPDRTGEIGISQLIYLLEVTRGRAADKARLRVDDAIVRAEDTAIRRSDDLLAVVANSAGRPLHLRVWRAGRLFDTVVTPEDYGDGFRIGVALGYQRVWHRFGPLAAVGAAVDQTARMTALVIDILGRLVTGRLSVRTLGGPVRIAQESGRAARAGSGAYFGLIAFLSINVGILNLLPLVPLDGGHLLLLMIEGVMRRELSARVRTWLMNTGAVVVFALIGFVLLSDLSKMGLFGRFLR
jgi:regulator of sigma E protease